MRLVPIDKFDDEACANLRAASDEELKPHLAELLECLQDLNWPIAAPVSDRLSMLGLDLVKPILKILSGNDEMWKYWVVSHLLYQVNDEVFCELRSNSMTLSYIPPTVKLTKRYLMLSVSYLIQEKCILDD